MAGYETMRNRINGVNQMFSTRFDLVVFYKHIGPRVYEFYSENRAIEAFHDLDGDERAVLIDKHQSPEIAIAWKE